MATAPAYLKFPNGRAYRLDHGFITALVTVDLDEVIHGSQESVLDLLSRAAVGSELLQDISYEVVGGQGDTLVLSVSGDVSALVENDDAQHCDEAEAQGLIAAQHGWSDAVRSHAFEASASYQDECVLSLANGRELRVPAHPGSCTYLRVTEAGYELGYWNIDEVREDPEDALGAAVGLAHG